MRVIAISVAVMAAILPSFPHALQDTADLIFRGGAVYTVDAARSWASAVVVIGNRIAYVGEDHGVEAFIGPGTRLVDLRGRMLLPGFQDSHIHPGSGGISMDRVVVSGVFDRDEIFRIIEEYAAAHPDQEWIHGIGWEEGAFKPSGLPDRHMLDELVIDRPAFLRNSSGHDGWANSHALEIAGIVASSPDPPNGVIERDATGEPTGVLHERAMELVTRHIPDPTQSQRLDGYRRAFGELARYGITAIIDASASPETDADYRALADAGELNTRTVLCQRYSPTGDDDDQVQNFLRRREQLNNTAVRASCVKIGLDGLIEQYTGALLQPYADRPDFRGHLTVEPQRLKRLVTRLDAEGFQVQVHVMGDRAVREILDAFETAQRTNGRRDSRHHLAHVHFPDVADIPRLRILGVAANMSPLWARGDDWETFFAPRRLGPDRSLQLLVHRSILSAGARLVFGTDWPVTSIVPFDGLETAVTRRHLGGVDPYGEIDVPWEPEERILLGEALAAYTIAGAELSFDEGERGSIEVGKLADLVVVDRNLFDVAPLTIHQALVDMTVFDGRIIYDRETASAELGL